MQFPNIDPVALDLGFFQIRWYALAYIAGLWLGMVYMKRIIAHQPQPVTKDQIDDLFVWVVLGVILGGRLGFVALYEP
ncbi:MAG: prolipoprotein diacylglyceryl transferase family protein, partial [Pseudomonadota bacterium]